MSMFTRAELAKAKQIRALSEFMEKRADFLTAENNYNRPYLPNYDSPHAPAPARPITYQPNGGLFGTNPRQFSEAWDLVGPQTYSWAKAAPRMTFGESLGIMGRGLGRQAGNYGQLLFTGHDGRPGILGNLASDAFSTLGGHPPSLHSLGQSFTEPWRRAMHGGPTGGLSEAYRMTGMPGEWLQSQVIGPNWQAFHDLLQPGPK